MQTTLQTAHPINNFAPPNILHETEWPKPREHMLKNMGVRTMSHPFIEKMHDPAPALGLSSMASNGLLKAHSLIFVFPFETLASFSLFQGLWRAFLMKKNIMACVITQGGQGWIEVRTSID